jgi:hypothetical protein
VDITKENILVSKRKLPKISLTDRSSSFPELSIACQKFKTKKVVVVTARLPVKKIKNYIYDLSFLPGTGG